MEILWKFLTARQLVHLRPCPAAWPCWHLDTERLRYAQARLFRHLANEHIGVSLKPAGWKNFDLTLAGQFLTPDWKLWVLAILLDTISKNMLTQTHVRSENHVKKWINDILKISDFWSKKHWERAHVYTRPKTSEDFGRLRKTLDFFGILRTFLGIFGNDLQKTQHSQDKNLTLISQKKLAGRHNFGNRLTFLKKHQIPSRSLKESFSGNSVIISEWNKVSWQRDIS